MKAKPGSLQRFVVVYQSLATHSLASESPEKARGV